MISMMTFHDEYSMRVILHMLTIMAARAEKAVCTRLPI